MYIGGGQLLVEAVIVTRHLSVPAASDDDHRWQRGKATLSLELIVLEELVEVDVLSGPMKNRLVHAVTTIAFSMKSSSQITTGRISTT